MNSNKRMHKDMCRIPRCVFGGMAIILFCCAILMCNNLIFGNFTDRNKGIMEQNAIDSIWTAQHRTTYYGIRLWPRSSHKSCRSCNLENTVALCLIKEEKAIIVSSASVLFYNRLYSIKSKDDFSNIFNGWRVEFDDDLPIMAGAISHSDSLIYMQPVPRMSNYELCLGVLHSNLLDLSWLSVGSPISELLLRLGFDIEIVQKLISKCNRFYFIHPASVNTHWKDSTEYCHNHLNSNLSFSMIICTTKNNKIQSVEFCNFGDYNLRDDESVKSFIENYWLIG